MDNGIVSSSPLPRLVRWAARVTSLLLFGLVMVIAVGQGGPPNPFRQPRPVQLEFAAMGLMLLGFIIGWVREGLGGLLVLLGLAGFNAVELAVNGRPALGAFPLFAVPGALFLLSALLGRRSRQQPRR
jgi:peptidoglycan/LPS O-acetylase OafA/YrhL